MHSQQWDKIIQTEDAEIREKYNTSSCSNLKLFLHNVQLLLYTCFYFLQMDPHFIVFTLAQIFTPNATSNFLGRVCVANHGLFAANLLH